MLGPDVSAASFYDLPTTTQPQELIMRFIVPAIHVRPTGSPCEVPGLSPENYPTPTRIPDIPPMSYGATPIPDIKTVGPFTLEFKMVIEPKPTQPVLPMPIPTAEGVQLPFPVPTGQP